MKIAEATAEGAVATPPVALSSEDRLCAALLMVGVSPVQKGPGDSSDIVASNMLAQYGVDPRIKGPVDALAGDDSSLRHMVVAGAIKKIRTEHVA